MNKETGAQEITVTMTKRRYLTLLSAEIKLQMLEAGGVDNWEWYGESLNPEDEESYSVAIEILENEIANMDN